MLPLSPARRLPIWRPRKASRSASKASFLIQTQAAGTSPPPVFSSSRPSLSQSRAALIYRTLFFLSGVSGLVYQLLWIRLLYQAFGSTIQSVTTVVAAYMGGLGLGAWVIGRIADRHQRPAR